MNRRLAAMSAETIARIRVLIRDGYGAQGITHDAGVTLKQANAVFALVGRDPKPTAQAVTEMHERITSRYAGDPMLAPDDVRNPELCIVTPYAHTSTLDNRHDRERGSHVRAYTDSPETVTLQIRTFGRLNRGGGKLRTAYSSAALDAEQLQKLINDLQVRVFHLRQKRG
jgi:hypothetical protein